MRWGINGDDSIKRVCQTEAIRMTEDTKIHLSLTGFNSEHVSGETISFLGKLLSFFAYNEIDNASRELLHLHSIDLEAVRRSAYKLYLLCEVVQEE